MKSAGPPLSISEMNLRSLQERLLSHLSHEEDFPPSTTQHKQCNEPLPRAPRSSPLPLTSRPPAMLKVQPNLQLQVFSSKSSLDINDKPSSKIIRTSTTMTSLEILRKAENSRRIQTTVVAISLKPSSPRGNCTAT